MHDPREGVSPLGTIETGAGRDRVLVVFEPALRAAAEHLGSAVSLYLYGSVATGMAEPPLSDIDLLTIGLPADRAADLSGKLSTRFSEICRAVEVAAAVPGDFIGDDDKAYGGRVFLRHYCVHLAGPDLHSMLPAFPADAGAARGFNGDIAAHAPRWSRALNDGADPGLLGRRVARKTLLAVAGLVSVHDRTWTTDRTRAANRWGEISPDLAEELRLLLEWANGSEVPDGMAVLSALDGVVPLIAASFSRLIGLWGEQPYGRI